EDGTAEGQHRADGKCTEDARHPQLPDELVLEHRDVRAAESAPPQHDRDDAVEWDVYGAGCQRDRGTDHHDQCRDRDKEAPADSAPYRRHHQGARPSSVIWSATVLA